MTARPRSAILMVSAVLLLGCRPGTVAAAQTAGPAPLGRVTSAPCGPVPLILLTWIKAPDKTQATKGMKELREAIRSNIKSSELCPVAKDETDAYLSRSGYPTDTLLSTMDARTLAVQVRADEFFEGEVKGFDFTGWIYLTRDDHAWLRERVPQPDKAASLSQGAKFFVEKMKVVRKEFEPVQRCYNFLGDQKFADAAMAAQQAIQAYPNGTIARICLATALQNQKKSADERLAVISEVLKRDPESPRALWLAITAYDEKGDKENFERVAGQFVAIDPGNKLVEDIVLRLIEMKMTDQALAFIARALVDDPDNKNLLRAEFRLIYGGGHWKEAIKRGEALAKLDTAVVDTFFVHRMVSAYARDSQPEKVLAWLKLATERFPTNAGFTNEYAQQLMTMGQVPEAIDAYKGLLRTQPAVKEIRLRIANAYNDQGQVDSALVWLHEADKHGDDKTQIAGVALQIGNALWTAANKTKVVADYDKAIPVLAFSDSIKASETAKFLWGGSLFVPAAAMVVGLDANFSCGVAKVAQGRIEAAQPLISAGGKTSPDIAVSWLGAITQYIPYLEGSIKAKKCS